MESNIENLLSHEEISEKINDSDELNPIDRFIYDNEPAGNEESEKFRTQLFEVLSFAKKSK